MVTESPNVSRQVDVPAAMALALSAGKTVSVLKADGEIADMPPRAAAAALRGEAVMLVHADFVLGRLTPTHPPAVVYDLLELFAFTLPAQLAVPTPKGLAMALGLTIPLEDEATLLPDITAALLHHLTTLGDEAREQAARTAKRMADAGWPFGPFVMAALGLPKRRGGVTQGFDVWNRLPEWEQRAPPPEPGDDPVKPEEAVQALSHLLDETAEQRDEQRHYAGRAAHAFTPRTAEGAPNIVLAEAGTGTGKTLGYVAPAGLWAERNEGTVWLSTFTKNLQRQLDDEVRRLYPDPVERAEKVVQRKGRENFLCLLNYQERVSAPFTNGAETIAMGLISRWAEATRDGAMVGGDFPTWLAPRLAGMGADGLTDRRGECVHSACPHVKSCFIERSIHKSRNARLVIANHALVMITAALASYEVNPEEQLHAKLSTRFVLDEGHHLFDAADSAFSSYASGREMSELRRWLRGAEGGRKRGRPLVDRVGPLLENADPPGEDASAEDVTAYKAHLENLAKARELLHDAAEAAMALPQPGYLDRIRQGEGFGEAEVFLAHVLHHIHARTSDEERQYSLEAHVNDPSPELVTAARNLADALEAMRHPLMKLADALMARLTQEVETLDGGSRYGIESAARGIRRRAVGLIPPWIAMLRGLGEQTPDMFVDRFELDRSGQRIFDVAYARHYIDPTQPLADVVLKPAHGAVITSATLRDEAAEEELGDWASAEMRTGASHLVGAVTERTALPSPFDYAANTRILIVNDLSRRMDDMGAAYEALFKASGGGALGLFTAIERLRGVHRRIFEPLADAGLPLIAQHVDALDNSTLIDLFRAERDLSLLGTDAMRDGVDVPGDALRLIVFDRVPWPRPDILHRARRTHFGGRAYEDMLTRLKLAQAFGRLIRRATDKGVFVLLDGRMPTRLLSAFPEGAPVTRLGLADAIQETRAFLHDD
ncbi:MAG: ATP-dependent DNA helicase [Alphaproteobacteria bacterium]